MQSHFWHTACSLLLLFSGVDSHFSPRCTAAAAASWDVSPEATIPVCFPPASAWVRQFGCSTAVRIANAQLRHSVCYDSICCPLNSGHNLTCLHYDPKQLSFPWWKLILLISPVPWHVHNHSLVNHCFGVEHLWDFSLATSSGSLSESLPNLGKRIEFASKWSEKPQTIQKFGWMGHMLSQSRYLAGRGSDEGEGRGAVYFRGCTWLNPDAVLSGENKPRNFQLLLSPLHRLGNRISFSPFTRLVSFCINCVEVTEFETPFIQVPPCFLYMWNMTEMKPLVLSSSVRHPFREATWDMSDTARGTQVHLYFCSTKPLVHQTCF